MKAFQHLVLLASVQALAYCKRARSHDPEEKMLAYFMGKDLPYSSRDGFFGIGLSELLFFMPSVRGGKSILVSAITPFVVTLAILGSLAFAGNAYLTSIWMNTWEKLGIPSPPCYSFLGNTMQIERLGGLRASVRYWQDIYGKVFGFHINKQPVLVVTDASMAYEILENEQGLFGDRFGVPQSLQRELMGKSVFLPNTSRQWIRFRGTLITAFSPDNLAYMVHRLCRCANNLAEYMEDVANDPSTSGLCTNLRELVASYSYDTMGAMLFGEELDHYTSPDTEFFKALKSVFDGAKEEFCGVSVPRKLKRLRKFFMEKVTARKQKGQDGMVDFLEIFMFSSPETREDTGVMYPKEPMKTEEIVGTLLHWVMHGHEPMVSTLQFALRILASFPDHQHVLRAEIDNFITKEEPSFNDLCSLPFMDLFLKEVLRMFPPVQEVWRYASAESTVQGVLIPAHCAILIPINLIHNNSVYFLEPDEFDPYRYHLGVDGQPKDSDVFLSFGGGARACLGFEVFLLQMKAALVYIMRKVRMERPISAEDEKEIEKNTSSGTHRVCGVPLKEEGVLRPLFPIHIKFEPRRPNDTIRLTPRVSSDNLQRHSVKWSYGPNKEKEMLHDVPLSSIVSKTPDKGLLGQSPKRDRYDSDSSPISLESRPSKEKKPVQDDKETSPDNVSLESQLIHDHEEKRKLSLGQQPTGAKEEADMDDKFLDALSSPTEDETEKTEGTSSVPYSVISDQTESPVTSVSSLHTEDDRYDTPEVPHMVSTLQESEGKAEPEPGDKKKKKKIKKDGDDKHKKKKKKKHGEDVVPEGSGEDKEAVKSLSEESQEVVSPSTITEDHEKKKKKKKKKKVKNKTDEGEMETSKSNDHDTSWDTAESEPDAETKMDKEADMEADEDHKKKKKKEKERETDENEEGEKDRKKKKKKKKDGDKEEKEGVEDEKVDKERDDINEQITDASNEEVDREHGKKKKKKKDKEGDKDDKEGEKDKKKKKKKKKDGDKEEKEGVEDVLEEVKNKLEGDMDKLEGVEGEKSIDKEVDHIKIHITESKDEPPDKEHGKNKKKKKDKEKDKDASEKEEGDKSKKKKKKKDKEKETEGGADEKKKKKKKKEKD